MTNHEVATFAIALISLCVSFWVVIRDRKKREIDILYQCYDRLQRAQGNVPFATISEFVEMDATPNDPRFETYREKSTDAQRVLDSELEFACYLVTEKEIDIEKFFGLFRGWLATRSRFWVNKSNQSKAKNHPYTVKVIMECQKRKLLPIKDNKKLRKLSELVNEFISN